MPSSYTTSGIELIGDGEQSGSWGDTTNTNLQIIDRLTSQAGTITLAGTTHTLSLSDGTLSDGQYAVLVFGGAPSGTNTVTISPNDAKRVFIVKNSSGESVVLTQGSGGNVTVADGKTAVVYCDGAGSGAEVVNVSDDFVSGTLSAIGALTPTDGNVIVGNGSTWVAEAGNTVLTSLGVTATASELNTMDGITADTSELNVLDGITASTAELNILDGATVSTAELNILDGATVSTAELNILDGATVSTAELNILDGVTATSSEINLLDGAGTNDEAAFTAGTSTTESLVSPAKVKAGVEGALNVTGSAPIFGVRAWVLFNGSTGSIIESGNVASVSRLSTGVYEITFDTAMPDANYIIAGTGGGGTSRDQVLAAGQSGDTKSTTVATVATYYIGGSNTVPADLPLTSVMFLR